jgi:hypothetical protein
MNSRLTKVSPEPSGEGRVKSMGELMARVVSTFTVNGFHWG